MESKMILTLLSLHLLLSTIQSTTQNEFVRNFTKKYDKNSNGVLEKDELLEVLKQKHKRSYRDEAVERIRDGDKDNDNKFTWEEYLAQMSEHTNKSDPDYEKMKQEEYEVFQHADKDHDGKITVEELATIIGPLSDEDSLKKHCEMVMKSADLDGDGKLSADELHKLLEVEHEGSTKSPQDLLKKFDKDGSGFVDMNELLDILLDDQREVDSREVQDYINMVDTNKDGALSEDEMIANYESLQHLIEEDYDDRNEDEIIDDEEHETHSIPVSNDRDDEDDDDVHDEL